MRRATRHWLLAGIALAVLAAAAWAQWRSDRAHQAATATLLATAPERIDRIELERSGHPALRYVRRDGHWQRLGNGDRRVDDGRLDDIAALAAAPVLRWRDATALDPAAIGLSPPALRLRLDGQLLEFGAMTAFGAQRYVRVGTRVAVVPAQYAPRPPEPARAGSRLATAQAAEAE